MDNSVAADILSEFLEVAVHSILHERQIYPPVVFEKRKKYNVPVHMCVHPGVTKYIQDVIESVKTLLSSNSVEKISVVIIKDDKPMEKFVFEIDINRQECNEIKDDDAYLIRLEQAIRAFCLKLNTCDALLNPLPSDCTFAIHIHTNESAAGSLEVEDKNNFPWIEADPQQLNLSRSHIIPMKYMDHNIFKLQLYVEENEQKR